MVVVVSDVVVAVEVVASIVVAVTVVAVRVVILLVVALNVVACVEMKVVVGNGCPMDACPTAERLASPLPIVVCKLSMIAFVVVVGGYKRLVIFGHGSGQSA